MKCPYCKSNNSFVVGGKKVDNGDYRRYRYCMNCGRRFKSLEVYVSDDEIRKRKGSKKDD